eukprot:Phypoly_transcript_01140.p1 GENE.Phypoly_transcript_01140~~Phypoly_transcript_01140.p1  ORF type:complete len:1157 (+),score=266.27 Phypoly_transcript_01140:117-3587(+)
MSATFRPPVSKPPAPPGSAAAPKLPAKPSTKSNLNVEFSAQDKTRLVNQRQSVAIYSMQAHEAEKERITSFSRSKLAGVYPSPGTYSQDDTNHYSTAPAPPPASSTPVADSPPVPPPKPAKPKFVDMGLTSSQLNGAQAAKPDAAPAPAQVPPAKPIPEANPRHSVMLKQPAGSSKVFENKTPKRNAIDKNRESFSDNILAEVKKVEDEKVFYTEMLDRIAKQTVAHSKSVDASQLLSQWLRDHGSRSVFAHDDPVFGKCILQAAEVLRFAEVLRSQVTLMWTNTVMVRANEFMMNDIDETLAIKNRVETLKNSLDATNAKLKNMTTKGKVNLVKLSELRRERDMLIIKYKEAKARTLPTILNTNHKHTTAFMGTMCDVLSEYSQFFQHGMSILANIETDVADYRAHIVKENEKFAKAQAEVEAAAKEEDEDLLEPKDEATFSDVLSKMLMESERIYQAQLDSTVKVYQQTFLSDGSLFSEIVKEDVTAIFGNMEVLADVQRKLLDTLLQNSSNLTTETISRSFANFTNVFSEVYSQYIKNHNRAQDTLEQCKKKSKALCNTLKVCEAKDTAPEKQELSVYLALPLERVKQYEAYFREISKKEKNEAVNAIMTQVLACFSALTTAALDSANQAKIKSILEVVNVHPEPPSIENTLTAGVKGVIGAGQTTLTPEEAEKWYSRRFIKEGPLNIVSRTAEKKAVKEYYFFLFNDLLMGVKRAGLPKSMGGSALAFLKGKVHAKHLWAINNAVVSDVADEDGIKYCISLTINGTRYILSAESEDAKQFWIFEITKALDQIEKRKIFGVPLAELMQQTNEVGRDIPSFFENCMEFILANAIDEEGIFRLSGSTNDIEKMRVKVDQGLELAFYGIPYHNVSGLFKLFMRSLPAPIVPYDLYGLVLGAAKMEPRSEKVRITKAVLEKLPPYNKYILQYLIHSLAKITQHVAKNKMTPYNLSIVFGPHCLKKRESDPVAELTDSKVVYESMQLMIEEHDAIFADIVAEREAVRQKRAQQQLELAQKKQSASTKQFKYEPSNAPSSQQPDDEDDEDEENDARLQGITISLKDIVKQGFLQKKGANRRNWTSRWFVLKNKYLFYFKNQKDQTPKGMISLVGVKLAPSDRKPYCFAIFSANREYLICGKNQTEVDEWMAAIKTCTSD